MPDPLRHVQPGEPISAELWNALVDRVRGLRLNAAFPLAVHRAGGGTHLSLARLPLEAVVQLLSDLAAGGSASAKVLWFHGQTQEWVDAGTRNITVYDPLGTISGDEGDKLYAWFDHQSGRWLVRGGASSTFCDFGFVIVEPIVDDDGIVRRALVEPDGETAPCVCAAIFGFDEYTGLVEVRDTRGCLLQDEAPLDLIGRVGYARFSGDGYECFNAVWMLCCPTG